MKSDQLFNALAGAVVAIGMTACGASGEKKSYNEGVNVIPAPASLTVGNGEFSLKGSTKIGAAALPVSCESSQVYPPVSCVPDTFAHNSQNAPEYVPPAASYRSGNGSFCFPGYSSVGIR